MVSDTGRLPVPAPLPDGVVLRALTEDHLVAAGRAYWRTYVGSPAEMTPAEAADDVRAAWAGGYGRWRAKGCRGAWISDDLVGAVITVDDPPWPDVPPGPFVTDLFVVPDARRRGIGRALLAAVLACTDRPVRLRVDDAVPEAQALYSALGFRVAG